MSTESAKRFLSSMLYWKLAIWKLANGCLKVGLMAFLGATAAKHWSAMNGDEKLVIWLTATVAVSTFVDAFIDQTMTTLRNGNGHSNGSTGTGNTSQFRKEGGP